jgi:hypothetical protein
MQRFQKLYYAFMFTLGMMVSGCSIDRTEHKKVESRAKYYFTEMDSNHDYFVSRSEYERYSDRKFNQADQDRSNRLSLDEAFSKAVDERSEYERHVY